MKAHWLTSSRQHYTLRSEQVAHLGLQRNQPAVDNSSNHVFLLPYPLEDGVPKGKKDVNLQPAHSPYDLVPFINWNKTEIIF